MKNSRKDLQKFSTRRGVRDRARRELLRLAEQTNVGTRGTKIKFTEEPYYRRSYSGSRGSEIIAEGTFSESARGFGFVRIEGEERDVFIPEHRTGNALSTDTVKIAYRRFLSTDGEIRTEGRVLSITEYGKACVIGTVDSDVVRLHKKRINRLYLIPDDGKIKRRIFLRYDGGAKVGDKVMAKLIRGEEYSYTLEADVLDNFGESNTKEANYLAVLAECEIDTEFTKEELRLAEEAASEPVSYEGRVVHNEVIFTIDSESAKDLDDAISLSKDSDGGYTLGVHIADVSHYIKEKTALDRLVMARATSVYFTDKVVPMLPPSLSNGACSLNPGEDKYTLSAIMKLDGAGNIISARVEPSVIRSRVKGIYSEINRIFDGSAEADILEKYKDCLPTLHLMHELYVILLKKSVARGALELESAEAEIILGENGEPIDIIKRTRGDAERMIEQFMLSANEAVATMLLEEEIPCVYRVHEPPPHDKMADFINYAHNLGFNTDSISAEKCESRDLAALMDEARERGIAEAVSYACLRSMSKAAYSEIHRPHFGLGIKNYCHFTSPIRRLSDLATHRIIHRVLFEGKAKEKYRGYAKRAAAAATDGELRATAAERRIDELYKCIYMSCRIGEIFDATVSSVTSFGIFTVLENTCEGLVPMSELPAEFFYDEKNLSLRSSKSVIKIGDKLKIRVEEADITRGKLLFSLSEEPR